MADAVKTIAGLRAEKGLTQQELADKLSVSRSLVSLWETGARTPDRISRAAMAAFFGVSESEILSESDIDPARMAEIETVNDEISEFIIAANVTASGEKASGGTASACSADDIIDAFLSKQSKLNREIFIGRYLFMKACKVIASEAGMSEVAVRIRLSRMRKKLRLFIAKEENHDR
ncbi:MAG: helix-turn-helix domain-containing protein [Clostridia bacterium]|nr:helix-turn-helix domain-containing protein [Clostridia bacterium]